MSAKASYKDVQIPVNLLGLINHMADVESYREELRNLGSQWDLLTILGQMSGTGMDMSETRLGFSRLTSELLSQLGLEILNKTVRDITAKAQVTVDIVIRNLFERTADIGFLATDEDIRKFLKSSVEPGYTDPQAGQLICNPAAGDNQSAASQQSHSKADLLTRFQEYVAKYSVYFNIILLDGSGRVLVQLDQNNPVSQSRDPLIQQALTTTAEYVEVYRHSDLLEAQDQSLIYAYRVTESNDSKSRPLGVLCLCFRFDNEMQGIFKNLRNDDDWSVLTLLDREGRVLASSDRHQIPLGVTMDMDPERDFKITRFAGREYLATTCATKGYQGFFGLGWYGHVMLPIEHAFAQQNAGSLKNNVAENILANVMQDSQLFSENLRSIPIQADHIQAELERTVWNGNVRESDTQSKVLLWNISDAGARTKKVFEESIGNLHETVISSLLHDVEFQAALSVDIMDRNLYERANDCRWWALTSDFRSILAKAVIEPQEQNKISAILAYINGLYTVYTNLFVFDTRGKILAVSNADAKHLVGTHLREPWVQQTLALKNSQDYCVSPFHATPLYNNEHTYIYAAAITDPNNDRHCVGGIGIVFDSTPQFRDMLQDTLLRNENGEVSNGCFAIFTDRNGQIISSTAEGFASGDNLPIDSSYLSLANGSSRSGIVELGDYYYAVGARTSSGYREYKVSDDYKNDIIGLIFMPVAQVTAERQQQNQVRDSGSGTSNTRDAGDVVELATFYVGQQWLGVRAAKVREAIYAERIIHIPDSPRYILGKVMYQEQLITVIDLRGQLSQGISSAAAANDAPIVIVETAEESIGLVVDALGQIPAVSTQRLEPINVIHAGRNNYIECMVKPAPHAAQQKLLLIIDPDRMMESLLGRSITRGVSIDL